MKSGECAILYIRDVADFVSVDGFLGAKLDEATRLEIILNSLADEYATFAVYFRSLGPDYTMARLLSEIFTWCDGLLEYAYHHIHPT